MGLTFTNTAATTAAVTNRFVTSTNMANGAYTLANTTPVWSGACLVTVTHTAVTGNDTLGTITVVGVDLAGQTRTDVITPLAGTVATGTVPFRTLVSATQAGWVINTGNDTIVVGCAAGNIVCGTGGVLGGVLVNNAVAATIVISDKARTIMTVPASQAAGTYYNLNGVEFAGFLKVATTSTNDVTVFHSSTVPTYATT
ncbi:MAG TPA: hypothetical protein VIH00_00235 [Candidatus Limnocylindrales bacterium]